MKTRVMVGAALITASIIGLLATVAWAATTKSSKSNTSEKLKGEFVTASTNLSGASDTQTVYTTAALPEEFFLTQFCASVVTGGIQLDATGFGGIAVGGATTGAVPSCITFRTPMVTPPGSNITCSTSAAASPGSYFRSIGGILKPEG